MLDASTFQAPHVLTCLACGGQCIGRTVYEAQNVRAACHGERSYPGELVTPRPRLSVNTGDIWASRSSPSVRRSAE